MSFQYKHVLMVGATSGIGLAMAERLISEGVKITAVGRRKDRLDQFVAKHGAAKADSVVFDIADIDKIPKFAADVTKRSPDIDCVFLNAGIQGRYDLSKPATVDVKKYNAEINVNFTSVTNLSLAFLPFLQGQNTKTSLIFTSSHLGIVPAVGLSVYSASKAALNAFILCLREENADSNVKFIEILTPPVQTELHDYMGAELGRKLGMPLDEFTELAYKELLSGQDQIRIGSIGPGKGYDEEKLQEVIDKRMEAFKWLSNLMLRRG